ncbi:uncharacterized protein [Drosophila pseudoobscura]|uniref:Uncharacterized protein n=1 Tax=Drosophila pseudoobscura pseudoobscura TaxID=46245 RepID=A0A6I8VXJ1_DROPS|nr:uncharacterized protein LOC6902336 [Drosophila pseudoobscura]
MDNSTTTLSYTHKQLTASKLTLEIDQRPESKKDSLIYQEKESAKRRQTKEFFRPWLDNKKEASPPTACPPKSTAPALGPTCRPTLAETPRQLSPREHQRRDRSLLSRRAEQAQAQYLQLMAVLEQQAHTNLYYRQLLPRQHQQFLKQMALDQQMLANGAQQ